MEYRPPATPHFGSHFEAKKRQAILLIFRFPLATPFSAKAKGAAAAAAQNHRRKRNPMITAIASTGRFPLAPLSCYTWRRKDMAMTDRPTDDIRTLYQQAFRDFGVALQDKRPVKEPTPADALAITPALRTHGRMDGRRLAERIEALCRAHQ